MRPELSRKLDEVCDTYAEQPGSPLRDPDGRTPSVDEWMWREEGRWCGWTPPPRRSWWWRLWVIRHVTALWLSWRVHEYAGAWAEAGIGIGGPHPRDLWVVEGAYHGYW